MKRTANRRVIVTALLLAGVGISFFANPARAGCGCEKAPPDAAAVRPNATYAGAELTIFYPDFELWQGYEVVFTSGIDGTTAVLGAEAIERRDLADGVQRPQLVVEVPYKLPLGPTSLTIMRGKGRSKTIVTEIDDSALTIVPAPVPIGSDVGTFDFPDFVAAVGRDGTVYVSLDMSGTTHARGVRAQALGYPLRFGSEDVVFYNSQGFLMQLLGENMPGLYSLAAPDNGNDSDVLEYARHEFNTYYTQHLERQVHEVDPQDHNWHLDGTPHIDHDHLILAIAGSLNGGIAPAPGTTPTFDLSVEVFSLFHHGLVATNSLSMSQNTLADSYDSTTGSYGARGNVGSHGDVRSMGLVALSHSAMVDGDATALAFDISGNAVVTGSMTTGAAPIEFMPVEVPGTLDDLGSLSVADGEIRTVSGPGSYLVSGIEILPGGELLIDNADGAVTLYVTGDVKVAGRNGDREARVTTVDDDPEKFAMYVADGGTVSISGNGSSANGAMHGLVYAPNCTVAISGQGQYYGAFIGRDVSLTGDAQVHFDTALRGETVLGGRGKSK